jgi:hypothetical protein
MDPEQMTLSAADRLGKGSRSRGELLSGTLLQINALHIYNRNRTVHSYPLPFIEMESSKLGVHIS